ncbi:hypothetical protein Brsp02_03075 [Brucella sp. NBRC 113783]
MTMISILDERVQIQIGDCLDVLAQMPSDSVDCVVTSPPYWGLRDYGVRGQMGLEPTFADHLAVMVQVFAEVRRVLKSTGTCWINYGDCYATTPNGKSAAEYKAEGTDDRTFRDKPFSTIGGVLKAKDLAMIPNRLAIALQEDGWWVRSEIIWAKPNPMPESIRDRPATAHEKIFMLTKSPRYFFDREAVKQPVSPNTNPRVSQDLARQEGSHRANGGGKTNGPMRAVVEGSARKLAAENQAMIGQKASREAALSIRVESRNLRNYEPAPVTVWNIATRGFSDAHFATFPPELAERCILAGCPKDGIVLDPFGGAGTTALVAARRNRRAILIELNPEYADIAKRRIEKEWRVGDDAPLSQADLGPLFNTEIVG